MTFNLKLLWREFKGEKFLTFNLFFLLFILTLVMQVLLNFSSLSSNVIEGQSKKLLGADLVLTSRFLLPPQQILGLEFSDSTELYTMATCGKGAKLVRLKAYGENFPFYGKKLDHLRENEVLLSKDLFSSSCQSVQIGESSFSPVIDKGEENLFTGNVFSLAPTVIIKSAALPSTKLQVFGHLATYKRFFKVQNEKEMHEVEEKLGQLYKDDLAITVKNHRESSQQLAASFNSITSFLQLLNFFSALISLVGVIFLLLNYYRRRKKMFGILFFGGMEKKSIYLFVFLFFLMILLSSSSLALFLNFFVIKKMISLYFTSLETMSFLAPLMKNYFLTFSVILLGPLLAFIPFASLFRPDDVMSLIRSIEMTPQKRLSFSFLKSLPFLIFIFFLALFCIRSITLASLLLGVLLLLTALSYGGYQLLLLLIKLVKKKFFSLELTHRKLSRLQGVNFFVFLSFTVAFFLFSTLVQLQLSIKKELSSNATKERPTFFFLDLQEEQISSFQKMMKESGFPLLDISPLVRAKLEEVPEKKSFFKGLFSSLNKREEERKKFFKKRGVNLSYRQNLGESNSLIKGRPFSETGYEDDLVEISVEQRYAKRMGWKLGDEVTFDIMGEMIKSKIINLRRVFWNSFRPNFFVLFPPGILEDAPKSFVAVSSSLAQEQKKSLLLLLEKDWPNLSYVDISEVLEKLLFFFEKISIFFNFMGITVIICALFVLLGLLWPDFQQERKSFKELELIGPPMHHALKSTRYRLMALLIPSCLLGQIISGGLGWYLSAHYFDIAFSYNVFLFLGITVFSFILLFIFSLAHKV